MSEKPRFLGVDMAGPGGDETVIVVTEYGKRAGKAWSARMRRNPYLVRGDILDARGQLLGYTYARVWLRRRGPARFSNCAACGREAAILYGSGWQCECGYINPLAETEDTP